MLATGVRSYAIDLDRPEPVRWAEVASLEQPVARGIVEEAAAELQRVPELARWVFAHLYRAFGGLYRGEIAAWAESLEVSVGTATLLNCAYELSHLRLPRPFGCTAGVRWVEGLGMVHVRNLDWPLRTMGPATRLFRFHRGAREFVSIGFPGHVGVLSGMLPGAYSVTINWAPPASIPSFNWGPGFLLRDTLETCDTYDAAVRRLTDTQLSTSVFYTVCGTEKGQGCVIERTPREAAVRLLNGNALVQSNHYVTERFAELNDELLNVVEGEEEFSLEGSTQRRDDLVKALAALPTSSTLEGVAAAADTSLVCNRHTVQQMVFCPRTSAFSIWRRVEV